jgi:UDP-N-acetylglucosamine 1-carboxyvinyltransferase
MSSQLSSAVIPSSCVIIEQSPALSGEINLVGAKNAVLAIMASLILTHGKSRLTNVPASDDVLHMADLLRTLGADVTFKASDQIVEVDTSLMSGYTVNPESMKKMRASILVMGPLLARFGRAHVALPGGCVLGARPIDFHLKGFARMGALIEPTGEFIKASATPLSSARIVLEYPSVGATENILMSAVLTPGITRIINAALEPEVFDLISVLTKMGARIRVNPPATLEVEGVQSLNPIEHAIMPDRLEAGSLLIAVAITGGTVTIPQAPAYALDIFLEKLADMGHTVSPGPQGVGVTLKSTQAPRAVSLKTMPYPGFPTDLQAPMMTAQCLASGTSIIHETVYENRLLHARELQKMGAQIDLEGQTAIIKGVDMLYGTSVIATDIRASAALLSAGLAAQGQTVMAGVHHLTRGYQGFDQKLIKLGARLRIQLP